MREARHAVFLAGSRIASITGTQPRGDGALYAFEPVITDTHLCRVIDALKGTQVDVFIKCVSNS